jgi:hypothetical protein
VALSIYGVNRIRSTRKARRAAYEPVDNNYYAREAAW